ncbi:MAG TPA: hypothetical protein EYG10_04995 [Gammaproteobacteria bacterium]|nr:hypothetical protein [Gammaproteobacteria bacterium]
MNWPAPFSYSFTSPWGNPKRNGTQRRQGGGGGRGECGAEGQRPYPKFLNQIVEDRIRDRFEAALAVSHQLLPTNSSEEPLFAMTRLGLKLLAG